MAKQTAESEWKDCTAAEHQSVQLGSMPTRHKHQQQKICCLFVLPPTSSRLSPKLHVPKPERQIICSAVPDKGLQGMQPVPCACQPY